MTKEKDLLQKAKDYAFLLLKFRLRSEKEIYQRLKKKKFAEEIIKETTSFLKDRGFINDTTFAQAWFESRLKKPLGLRKIKQELKVKGINEEIIEGLTLEIKKNYSEDEAVSTIAKQRLKRLKGIEPDKAKRRVYAYLMRRGFSPETIINTLG